MPFIIFLAVLVIIIAATSLRKVHPYQRGVIERLGRYLKTAEPGLTLIIPFFDSMMKVDMREQVVDVPPQEVITKDNVGVNVDAVIYYEATDSVKLVYNVANFYVAVTKLAQSHLRNVVGEMELDEALVSREIINAKLRQVLDEATDKWGVRVVRVEIKRIDPPGDVMDAMHRQMKAERIKRAEILESEGKKQSQILEAEGLKQAQILEAEGLKQAKILAADAKRYELETEAAGEANAVHNVFTAIKESNPDEKVIALKYLEALQSIANTKGEGSKVFIPYEAAGVMSSVGSLKEIFAQDGIQGQP